MAHVRRAQAKPVFVEPDEPLDNRTRAARIQHYAELAMRPRPRLSPRYEAFLRGDLTIDDLDEEEIMRGQIKNGRGDFGGRPPQLVPKNFMDDIIAKRHDVYNQHMAPLVLKALKTLEEVMDERTSMRLSPQQAARVSAAKVVLERTLGRVPETVNIKREKESWEKVMDEMLVVVNDPNEKEEDQ